jgi:hypothetical protein
LLQKAEQNRRANGTIDYDRVALAFDGKFTALQVRAKYRNVEGLKIKKDGKLQKKRNISPVTVLEYYKWYDCFRTVKMKFIHLFYFILF